MTDLLYNVLVNAQTYGGFTMNAVKEYAFAKINLFLEVVGKRADGFHDLNTVMHSVTLADEITVAYAPSRTVSVRLESEGNKRLPHDGRNLSYRAAELFMERSCKTGDIHIRLNKRIPVAAGLGGGSSDAAATLRALNRIFDGCFTERALLALAAELGSDIPFCLVGGTALCRGRGEEITKLSDPRAVDFVVAITDDRVSTPAAFGVLDGVFSDFDGKTPLLGAPYFDRLTAGLSGGEVAIDGLYNNFEVAILPTCHSTALLKAKMLELGARGALMSGSGPSVFGIFATAKDAESAARALVSEGITAFAVSSARKP